MIKKISLFLSLFVVASLAFCGGSSAERCIKLSMVPGGFDNWTIDKASQALSACRDACSKDGSDDSCLRSMNAQAYLAYKCNMEGEEKACLDSDN